MLFGFVHRQVGLSYAIRSPRHQKLEKQRPRPHNNWIGLYWKLIFFDSAWIWQHLLKSKVIAYCIDFYAVLMEKWLTKLLLSQFKYSFLNILCNKGLPVTTVHFRGEQRNLPRFVDAMKKSRLYFISNVFISKWSALEL